MSQELLYYHPTLIARAGKGRPDLHLFSHLFKILKRNVALVDRSGAIRFPIAVKSMFPIPAPRLLNKDYEQICDERAVEILTRADQRNCLIYVLWSGGIDSTLVLVSLLKHATEEQKKRIVVLLSEESISEAPEFYRDHICGRLRADSALMFPYLLGGRHLFVSGELNDQLFGSDMVARLMVRFGPEVVHQPYSRDLMRKFFGVDKNDKGVTNFYLDIFERLAAAAPIDISTNFQVLWWINFSMKWQSVFLRTLSYAAGRNLGTLDAAYVSEQYLPFFSTDEFQLWSLTNSPDRKIKDSWTSYKWLCKDIIYDYTKNEDYRKNKVKRGSLFFLILGQSSYNYIDANFNFSQDIDMAASYAADNDFLPGEGRPTDIGSWDRRGSRPPMLWRARSRTLTPPPMPAPDDERMTQ